MIVGPATNLAVAVRKHPEIVPLVKRVIYMGGALDVPGNTSPAAEFNWWFDPEAARIALRTPFREQIVVPLDICEKVFYTRAVYQRIAAGPKTPITDMFRELQGPEFAKNPQRKSFVWDSLAAAILIEPKLATKLEEMYVDVDATYGPNYGKSFGYRANERRDLRRPGRFPRRHAEGQSAHGHRPQGVLGFVREVDDVGGRTRMFVSPDTFNPGTRAGRIRPVVTRPARVPG